MIRLTRRIEKKKRRNKIRDLYRYLRNIKPLASERHLRRYLQLVELLRYTREAAASHRPFQGKPPICSMEIACGSRERGRRLRGCGFYAARSRC